MVARGGSVDAQGRWVRLEYSDCRQLARCLKQRQRRILFYPAVGRMQLGHHFDVDVAVSQPNTSIPLRVLVVGRRSRPKGAGAPRGVYLEIVEADSGRYQRLCDLADGKWQPGQLRRYPRARTKLAARYYIPKSFHSGVVADISLRGMFLRTQGPLLKRGQGVLVRVRTGWWARVLEVEARVCWLDEIETRRGMGLECFGPPQMLPRLQKLAERIFKKNTLSVNGQELISGGSDAGKPGGG